MMKIIVSIFCLFYLDAQFPPKCYFSPSIKNVIHSIDGSIRAVAPDGWSSTYRTFGFMPDVGLGEGYDCVCIRKKMYGSNEGFEDVYFAFKIYHKDDIDGVLQKAISRQLHPWLNFPPWSSFKHGAIDGKIKTHYISRNEYRPSASKMRSIVFCDTIFIAPVGKDVIAAYFHGGRSRHTMQKLFFELLNILNNNYILKSHDVKCEITQEEVDRARPDTLEDALAFLDKWMSVQEKDAILAAWGKKAPPADPVPMVDGSDFSQYLAPFQNGRCSWEDWISRHWGLGNGDSPLARFLELKGKKNREEKVVYVMKSFCDSLNRDERRKD